VVGDVELPLGPDHSFDVVTAVPPYVPTGQLRLLPADVQRYEPRVALDGGANGLDVARRVVSAAGRLLVPGGWLLIELGGNQDDALAPDLAASGFADIESWRDEDGDLRGLAAQIPITGGTR
jgi:release factor glutamine methyltransferase